MEVEVVPKGTGTYIKTDFSLVYVMHGDLEMVIEKLIEAKGSAHYKEYKAYMENGRKK